MRDLLRESLPALPADMSGVKCKVCTRVPRKPFRDAHEMRERLRANRSNLPPGGKHVSEILMRERLALGDFPARAGCFTLALGALPA